MLRKIVLTLLTIFLFILSVVSQEKISELDVIDYTTPGEYFIKDIDVEGIKYLDKRIVANISGLREGTTVTIPGEQITRAIENLWSQGLFSDVKILASEVSLDTISLTIRLQEQPRLSRLIINGLKKSREKDVREKLKLRPGSQITKNVINNTRSTIEDYLYDKKFRNTEIDIQKIDDSARVNRVILKVNIDKNKKVKIKNIVFKGNTVFRDGQLRRAMEHTHRQDLNIFKGSKFIREKYEEDKEKVLEKYRKEGYRDARIVDDTVYAVSNKRLMIQIEVEEGDQYFFRDINWTGNTKYPSELLTENLKIERGDPFDKNLLNERINIDQDAVGNLYLDKGYLFFSAEPVVERIENDSVDVEIRIHEGKQARLNKIIITGNTKTNEHVARRELRTKPGDLFSKTAIQRSQRELAQLGHFDPENMGIEPINISQSRGEVDLHYSLVEKATDQLEISGGWGAGMLVGTIGLRFNNFAASRIFEKDAWRPVPSGDGQSLSIRAQTNGQYYKNYSMTFTEPWLGGKKPNRFSVSLYHSVRTNATYFYQSGSKSFKITGASVSLQRRLKWPDDYFLLSHSLSYKQYNLTDWDYYFIMENGTSNNLSLGTTFSRNSVDQPIYPRRGSNFSISLSVTPPYSLINDNVDYKNIREEAKYEWIEYHKWQYKGKWFLKLIDDLVLAANTEFGYLGYFNENIGFSPFGSFELGGDGISGYNLYGRDNIALRGYENSSLTPTLNGKYAGNIYEKVYLELRYPVSLKPQATVYFLGFIEAGNAWYNFDSFDPFNLKRSAGIGVRAFLPMFGLLGIDWGYGFDEVPGLPDANGGQFHFVIGQQF